MAGVGEPNPTCDIFTDVRIAASGKNPLEVQRELAAAVRKTNWIVNFAIVFSWSHGREYRAIDRCGEIRPSLCLRFRP